MKSVISVIWLDLAKVYGSVPHATIQLAIKMILKTTDVKVTVIKPRLKAFMDDITVLAKGVRYNLD